MPVPTDTHYKLVTKSITDGRVVPFFGPGVDLCDRPAGMAWQRGQYLPSGGELAEYLANEFGYPLSETRDLARVSQYIAVMAGTGALYNELHSLFDADYRPTILHRFFATLPGFLREKGYSQPNQLIVTTNYDDLMERAFQDEGEPFDLVSYVSEGEQRGKFLHWPPEGEARLIEKPNEYRDLSLGQRPVVLKIHGTVDRTNAEWDSFVITEDDYIEYLSRTDLSYLLPSTLLAKLRRSHILFLGYGMTDWNLRVILHRIWGRRKLDWKSWAIQLRPDPFEVEIWRQRDVAILDMPLQDYVSSLAREQTLLPVVAKQPDDAAPPLEQIRRASTRSRPPAPTYRLLLSTDPRTATVFQPVRLRAELVTDEPGEGTFEPPAGVTQLHCMITEADGVHIISPGVASMSLTQERPRTEFEIQPRFPGTRSCTIALFAEDERLLVAYRIALEVSPPESGEERPSILPAMHVRVARPPDLVLLVDNDQPSTNDSSQRLTYRLSSRLPGLSLEHEKVGQVTLRPADLDQIRTMVHCTVRSATHLQPEDLQERMLSLGRYLFDRLFPADGVAAFREAFWQVEAINLDRRRAGQLPPTWLIVEDGIIWLPWELVTPYRDGADGSTFSWGERSLLSRWVRGMGRPLYNEVPVGDVALAHYKVLDLGAAETDEELLSWRHLLKATTADGILRVARPEEPYYGLHLLRHVDPSGVGGEITARDGTARVRSPDEEVPRAGLDLLLKRPVVALSILEQNASGLQVDAGSWLLPQRVLPFVRAGASAVLGPWWPTSEAADRIFWSTFYDMLERPASLGEATWRARRAVKRALPHRPDWLAYTLFGHPRAQPYWPEPSEGYTALECQNPDEPLRPGKTYRFQASIRSRPPVWYQDRLVQADKLPQQPMAHFLAPGIQTTMAEPVMMTPLGRTMVQATYELTPEEEGEFPLIVRFLDGDERLQSLRLMLEIAEPTS